MPKEAHGAEVECRGHRGEASVKRSGRGVKALPSYGVSTIVSVVVTAKAAPSLVPFALRVSV